MDVLNSFEVCRCWDEAEISIRRYEVETNAKFSTYRKDVSFNKPGQIEISKHKIQFEDVKESGKEQCITFTGVPFVVLGAKYLDCIYGADRNKTAREKRFQREEEMRKLVVKVTGDPSLVKRRRVNQNSKKIGCPASIIVREVVFFPDFLASKDTRWFRTETSRLLREAFAKDGTSIRVERRFYLRFPDVKLHRGHSLDGPGPAVLRVEAPPNHIPVPALENESDASTKSDQDLVEIIKDPKNLSRESEKSPCKLLHDNSSETLKPDTKEDEQPANVQTHVPESTSTFHNNGTNMNPFFDCSPTPTTAEESSCVSPQLALGVQQVWTHGVDENTLCECFNRIVVPGNCEFLNPPPLHRHLQHRLSECRRVEEENNLGHQILASKATIPVIQMLDKLNSLQPGAAINVETIEALKAEAESSFVCLSQLNFRLLHSRKDNLLAGLGETCVTNPVTHCDSAVKDDDKNENCNLGNEENEDGP